MTKVAEGALAEVALLVLRHTPNSFEATPPPLTRFPSPLKRRGWVFNSETAIGYKPLKAGLLKAQV